MSAHGRFVGLGHRCEEWWLVGSDCPSQLDEQELPEGLKERRAKFHINTSVQEAAAVSKAAAALKLDVRYQILLKVIGIEEEVLSKPKSVYAILVNKLEQEAVGQERILTGGVSPSLGGRSSGKGRSGLGLRRSGGALKGVKELERVMARDFALVKNTSEQQLGRLDLADSKGVDAVADRESSGKQLQRGAESFPEALPEDTLHRLVGPAALAALVATLVHRGKVQSPQLGKLSRIGPSTLRGIQSAPGSSRGFAGGGYQINYAARINRLTGTGGGRQIDWWDELGGQFTPWVSPGRYAGP